MNEPLVSTPDATVRYRPPLGWAVNDSWVLIKRSLRHIIRNLDQLLSVLIQPIMFMLLFRYVFGGAIDTGETSYVNFLTAGVLVQQAAFGASTTAIGLAVDLQRGIVDRFRSLPMFSPALLIGHIVADLTRNTISALIMFAVAFAVGFRPNANVIEWALVFGLLLLFTLAVSWMSAILGLMVKSLEAAQWFAFLLILPLTFLSSAYVPTDSMPKALRVFAENQPITHAIEAMRAWMVGTPLGNHGWLAFIWFVAIIAVTMPIATWMFRHQTPRSA
jgi:ABC-2 type transport system permease protein